MRFLVSYDLLNLASWHYAQLQPVMEIEFREL